MYFCVMLNDLKPVLRILLRFVGIYLILVFLYQMYLNQYDTEIIDPFSRWVAGQANWLQNVCGFSSTLQDGIGKEGIRFIVRGEYLTRMVEGCNAISVMIMFVAFIFAFYKGAKTFLFVVAGLVALHLMNFGRIASLNMVIADYPDYGKMFHDYVFPGIIYGTVIILWIVWIKFFALKQNDESA
ncbi:exosortase family protein XrtF [Chryseobacterium sp. POL2]|uniref:exosortase family protein XrtF n=1 Tax=Chryseobacterium sp. POL2 TaxID=2713414 RepID=UPI001E5D91E8|nr:exosortase family protein XrtF [Chryseobacterium sp. POL2]